MPITKFETTTCGRCGGSGNYSFNLIHGSRCYGCGGAGQVLTKRGKAAQAWFRARLTRPAMEYQPGWLVFTGDLSPFARGVWVKPMGFALTKDNCVSPNNTVAEFMVPRLGRVYVSLSQPMRMVASIEERDRLLGQALEYQATLSPKTGKPLKLRAKAVAASEEK